MSLNKFIAKYSDEFSLVVNTLIPLVESSNIFKEHKDELRSVLEDAKERITSMDEWLEKHINDEPVVIKQSDIDAAVARYLESHKNEAQPKI